MQNLCVITSRPTLITLKVSAISQGDRHTFGVTFTLLLHLFFLAAGEPLSGDYTHLFAASEKQVWVDTKKRGTERYLVGTKVDDYEK